MPRREPPTRWAAQAAELQQRVAAIEAERRARPAVTTIQEPREALRGDGLLMAIARPEGMPKWAEPDVDLGSDVYVAFTHWSAEHHPDAPNPTGGFLIHRLASSPTGWCA